VAGGCVVNAFVIAFIPPRPRATVNQNASTAQELLIPASQDTCQPTDAGTTPCPEKRVDMLSIELYRISASAPANPESGHFAEIRPSPAPTKFLAGFAGFGRYQ